MNTLTFTSTFVHVIYLLILTNRNWAAFGRSLQRNEADRSGLIKHTHGYVHEGQEEYNNAKGLGEQSGKNKSHSRRERSVTGDSGFGSRIDAGSTVALDSLQRSAFKSFGKRAMDDSDGYTLSAQRFLAEYGLGSRLPEGMAKRVPLDFGYGSRTRVGDNLAKTNSVLYGHYGPGKRAKDFFSVEDELFGPKSGSRIASDGGYGSRVTAGEEVAKDYETSEIFGEYGPGK
ncbi:hypothetical protein DPMN_192930 [Dreissena polymorpha]|uniref:Uncharacterized protein n=1 Tax=Dreissena polymorpha TaxID=45954 RepID=A0A9D4B6E4_DREPO|nr:hypothetical protein DPMN_192930 [Dreissena polymorpha]